MRLGRSRIAEGVSHLDVTTPRISVLAGGQVDGPTLGIPARGGDTRFLQRFALVPHDSLRTRITHSSQGQGSSAGPGGTK